MATTDTTSSSDTDSSVHGTVERVAQSAHQAIDKAASQAGPAIDRLHTMASDAARTIHDKADALGAMEEEWLETARDYVREHPLRTVAAALVAGVLISRLAR